MLFVVQMFVTPPTVGADTETFISVFGDLGVLLPFTSPMEQQPPSLQTLKTLGKIVNSRAAMGLPSTVFNIGEKLVCLPCCHYFDFVWVCR